MTKEKKINSRVPITEKDVHRIMGEWVDAIDEFNQWKDKLLSMLDTPGQASGSMFRLTSQRGMAELLQLRTTILHGLDNLLNEVNRLDQQNDVAIIMENLVGHTKTIHQWNEKIRKALEMNSFGNA